MSNDAEAKAASEKQLELSRRKIELMNKINQLKERKEALLEAAKSQPENNDGNNANSAVANLSLPTCDDVHILQTPNLDQRCSDLTLTINKPGWIVKGVIMYNEHLFPNSGGHHIQMNSISSN